MTVRLDIRPASRMPGVPYTDLYTIHAGAYGPPSKQPYKHVTELCCRTCGILFGVDTSRDPEDRIVRPFNPQGGTTFESRFIRAAISLEPIYAERGTAFFEAMKKPPRGQRGTMPDERLTLRLACFISGGVSRGVTIVQFYMLPISVKCRHCGSINEVTAN